jgi:hypothetical protein
LPGNYTVRLTANGQQLTVPLSVKMDPRVTTSAEGLRQQFELEMKIADALNRDFDALQQVRQLRQQIKNARGIPAERLAALDASAATLEGTSGGFGASLTEPGLARLNSALSTLYSAVDSADAAPTSQAAAMFTELSARLDQQLTAWHQLQTNAAPLPLK